MFTGEPYVQFFVLVCKPDSHLTLYEWLASLAGANGLETRPVRHWNGKHGEIWSYRLVNQLPLRAGDKAMMVNWFELRITYEEMGKFIYHNAWVTNHLLTRQNVSQLVVVGRATNLFH